jgi:hypothetical protein
MILQRIGICLPLLVGAALVACGEGEGEAGAAAASREFSRVSEVRVEASDCAGEIGEALAGHGFTVTDSRRADATLDVAVSYTAQDLDGLPNFRGVGSEASYDLRVRDSDGKVLVHTTGKADAARSDEFCDDLGERVAEGLQRRKSG